MAFAFCTFFVSVASPQAYQILHFAFTAAPIIATPRDFGLWGAGPRSSKDLAGEPFGARPELRKGIE